MLAPVNLSIEMTLGFRDWIAPANCCEYGVVNFLAVTLFPFFQCCFAAVIRLKTPSEGTGGSGTFDSLVIGGIDHKGQQVFHLTTSTLLGDGETRASPCEKVPEGGLS